MTNGFTNNHQFSPRNMPQDNQADLRDELIDGYINENAQVENTQVQMRLNTVVSVVKNCYKNPDNFDGPNGEAVKRILPCLSQASKEETLHLYEGLEVVVKDWLSGVKRELRATYKSHTPTCDTNANSHTDYLKCVFVYYSELEKIYFVTCQMIPSLETTFLKERCGSWLMMNRCLWHNEVHTKTRPNLNWEHRFIKCYKEKFFNLERQVRKAAFEFQLVESSFAKEKSEKYKCQSENQYRLMPQYEEWQNNFKKSSEKNSPDKNSPDKKPSEDNTGETSDSKKKSHEEQIREVLKNMPQYRKTEADVYRDLSITFDSDTDSQKTAEDVVINNLKPPMVPNCSPLKKNQPFSKLFENKTHPHIFKASTSTNPSSEECSPAPSGGQICQNNLGDQKSLFKTKLFVNKEDNLKPLARGGLRAKRQHKARFSSKKQSFRPSMNFTANNTAIATNIGMYASDAPNVQRTNGTGQYSHWMNTNSDFVETCHSEERSSEDDSDGLDPDIPQAKMSRENLVQSNVMQNDKQLCNKAIVQDQIDYQINYVQTMYVHNNQQNNQNQFARKDLQNPQFNRIPPQQQCQAVANQQNKPNNQVGNQPPQQVAKQHASISAGLPPCTCCPKPQNQVANQQPSNNPAAFQAPSVKPELITPPSGQNGKTMGNIQWSETAQEAYENNLLPNTPHKIHQQFASKFQHCLDDNKMANGRIATTPNSKLFHPGNTVAFPQPVIENGHWNNCTSFVPDQPLLGEQQIIQNSYPNINSKAMENSPSKINNRRKLKAKKTKGVTNKINNPQQAQAAMHVLKNNQQNQQNIQFPHQQMPNQPFNQPFNGQMVHGQMITNGCNQQQMVHPQHKALLTPSPSANLTAGPHNQNMLQHSQMVANQIMNNYNQNNPQMVRNQQQMVPNQPFQQNMVQNKQMVPPNGHINQQMPVHQQQMQPVDPNQPRPVNQINQEVNNGPNNQPPCANYQQQNNGGRQIPSECKYQNGEIQKGDKSYCSCCYCEFFGNGAPVQAPLPKNYIENRDRLRKKLNKKQTNEPQSSRGNSSEQNRDIKNMEDLDALCNFIEGPSTSEKKKKNKKKKNNNNTQNELPPLLEKDLYVDYLEEINPECKNTKGMVKYRPAEKKIDNNNKSQTYNKMSAQQSKNLSDNASTSATKPQGKKKNQRQKARANKGNRNAQRQANNRNQNLEALKSNRRNNQATVEQLKNEELKLKQEKILLEAENKQILAENQRIKSELKKEQKIQQEMKEYKDKMISRSALKEQQMKKKKFEQEKQKQEQLKKEIEAAELEAEKKAARDRAEAKIKAEKLRRMEAGQKRMVEKLNKNLKDITMNTDNKPSSSKQDTSKISNKSSSNNISSTNKKDQSKKAVSKNTDGSSKVEAELVNKVMDLKIDEGVAPKDSTNDSPSSSKKKKGKKAANEEMSLEEALAVFEPSNLFVDPESREAMSEDDKIVEGFKFFTQMTPMYAQDMREEVHSSFDLSKYKFPE